MKLHLNEIERVAAMAYSLTPAEARTFVAIRESVGVCPLKTIHDNDTHRKVLITKLRGKLRAHGIAILNIWGEGYVMASLEDHAAAMAKKAERKAEILKLYMGNEKLDYIASLFGISHTTVSKMAKTAGLPQRQPRC